MSLGRRVFSVFKDEAMPNTVSRSKTFAVHAFLAVLAAGVIAGCSAGGSSVTPGGSHGRSSSNISRALPATSPTPAPAELQQCTDGTNSDAGCQVKRNPNYAASGAPSSGLTPSQLRSAYGLPGYSGGGVPSGPTVAIVAAFEAKHAESDLGTYRSQFGLPPCTSNNGCFTKVMMTGSKIAPGQAKKDGIAPDAATWADEIDLDLAMASAACPNCKLLLVEAGGQDLDTLAAAENLAASYNPAAIGNSWGVVEGGGNAANIDPDAQAAFNHPGIAITASSGDLGQVQFPASSPYVTAVGGTTLKQDATTARGWSETVWASSGYGCSIVFPAPAWQTSAPCSSGRSTPDVSMIADYNPGVAVYNASEGGWVVLGGTSVGAPFVAGLYAAANDYGAGTFGAPSLYAGLGRLNAISGSAGFTNGSPNGLAGF
ncbi:MAG TPA: hypothetical protein VHS78_13135 [Candidatus Elarobacter sp.]|jgi:subtilase family serine protease|nr:hypothetical protein [Candidatus Elarobacter sp.]